MTRRPHLSPGFLLATGLFCLVAGPILTPPAEAQPTVSCVIRITAFAFQPSRVGEGQGTALRLRAKNCTDRRQNVTLTEYGNQPPPCPVIDPYPKPVSFRPFQMYTPDPEVITAPPCPGTESITVTFTDASGRLLATKTAELLVTPPDTAG